MPMVDTDENNGNDNGSEDDNDNDNDSGSDNHKHYKLDSHTVSNHFDLYRHIANSREAHVS